MAGYSTKIIAAQSGIATAVEGVTAANGYDVTIVSVSVNILESPHERSRKEFPRAYIYIAPEEDGPIERTDRAELMARWSFRVDVWVHAQDATARANLPKYPGAVLYAIDAWCRAQSAAALDPTGVTYSYQPNDLCVASIKYSASAYYAGTDR